MKHLRKIIFLAIFIMSETFCLAQNRVNPDAIGIPNEDGVILYYNLSNAETKGEVSLTYHYYYKHDGLIKYPDDYWSNYTEESIKIPKSINYRGKEYKVTKIGKGSFGRSPNLESIVIPEGITSIDQGAFANCSKLKTIALPTTLTSLGVAAFEGCCAIETIISHFTRVFTFPLYFNGDKNYPTFEQIVYDNAILYVPIGTAVKYSKIDGWKKFLWIEEGDPTDIKELTMENKKSIYYTINGLQNKTPKHGINIIKIGDGTTKKIIVKQKK